ncbi:MAG: hypothetical protein MUE50_01760 [Pirellulaceae bacterium]|nr:hypothetical protein [Pirellulaceae bacterium]MCU0979835.1 hypothetical protein [Pirellulaceae bacterium]
MVATYEKFGIRFLYPENWTVSDEQLEDWPRSVSIQSPQGAYWELQVYPSRINPARLVKQALAAMEQIYEDLEAEPVTEELWEVAATGYDLHFFCLDFLVTSRIRGFYAGSRTCVLTCQAESREFDRQQAVFSAMTKSLLDET